MSFVKLNFKSADLGFKKERITVAVFVAFYGLTVWLRCLGVRNVNTFSCAQFCYGKIDPWLKVWLRLDLSVLSDQLYGLMQLPVRLLTFVAVVRVGADSYHWFTATQKGLQNMDILVTIQSLNFLYSVWILELQRGISIINCCCTFKCLGRMS